MSSQMPEGRNRLGEFRKRTASSKENEQLWRLCCEVEDVVVGAGGGDGDDVIDLRVWHGLESRP